MRRKSDGSLSLFAAAGATLLAGALAAAQPAEPTHHQLTEPGPDEVATLYATGEQVVVQTHTRWKLICGSDDSSITHDEFLQIIERNKAATGQADPNAPAARGGPDFIFSVTGAIPTEAPAAIAGVESYLEGLFGDPITVNISIHFEPMSGSVLGATGSDYASDQWTDARLGLVNGMDSDDTIQTFLPTGSDVPVRYNGNSGGVSAEDRLNVTRANYRAAIGHVSGRAASMSINTNVNWDWNPANGVPWNRSCFQSVLVHEIGHAMGFVSSADNRFSAEMDLLDIYRFQRTDGDNDYNPDTLAELTTTPRLVDYNTPDDDHITDLIFVEYRMSDGSPWQASHFRDQGSNIGLMAPALPGGTTFYPNFFKTSDINVFDAIGWDYPPVPPAPIPVAVDDAFTTPKHQPLVITRAALLANDHDPDDDPLNLTSFTQPLSGSLVDNGDQTFTYTPALAFTGVDTFTYTLTDDDGSDDAIVVITVTPAPTTYRVDLAASGAGTGLTWANALTSLDTALAMAVADDEIWVAEGVYRPAGAGRTATFTIPADVEVYGGFPAGGGDNTFAARNPAADAFETILSGDLADNDHEGDRSDNTYHVVTMPAGAATLDGFTIRGGTADGAGASNQDRGAGLLINGGSATLRNLRIIDNHATFIGGGLFSSGATTELVSCTLLANSAPRGGGAGFSNGSATIVNLAASGNSSNADGAALYLAGLDAHVTNITCTDNTAANSAVAAAGNATVQLRNAILADNSVRALAIASGATVDVDHSLIQGGQAGVNIISGALNWLEGNLDAAPLLVNQRGPDAVAGTGDEDFTPGPGSPAIDAGVNDAVSVTVDLLGQARRVDAVHYDDIGSGTAPIVDIGAVEAPADTPLPAPGCACETDGNDAQVDVFDLLAYLDLWFAGDAQAERTGDDPVVIDVFDLLSFLDCWFPASAGNPCS